MDGLILDLLPPDAIAPSAVDLLAALPGAPWFLATALVILIFVAGVDAMRPDRSARR